MKVTHMIILFLFSLSLSSNLNTRTNITPFAASHSGSSRALMASKTQAWQGFMSGSGNCISVVKDAAICGWKMISAGWNCFTSIVRCIVPKCSKCCGGGIFSWACVPCRCSWSCSTRKCKENFKKAAASCKITADGCIKAFNALGNATKNLFKNIGNAIKSIANKIAHAAKWVAEKAWAAVKWVWDQILKLADLIKFFEVAKAIGNAFSCFGKLGGKSAIQHASNNANKVKGAAETGGKNSVINSIDGVIPGFKAMVCCMQQTAIGKVLNKWGKSLLSFHKNWKGLKVGSFLDDPALVISLAASVSSGYSVGTSLDIAISTAFNIGLYWTFCAGFETDVAAGVSVVVNLFRKFSFIPGQSIAVSFSVGIPKTPIGVGAGVVLPIGNSGVDFGAVNVEIGRGVGIAPASIGGHVCDTKKLVEFNLIELIGNILTAGNACPQNIPKNPNPAPAPPSPAVVYGSWGAWQQANWWGSFDHKGWSRCAHGYALTGLWRNSCHELYCLEMGGCRKPNGISAFTSCYTHNVWSAFDRKGNTSCKTNYYLAGFWRNNRGCEKIYCIENFWCCTSPGTTYQYAPKAANWWSSFDRKGWSSVPGHTWMTGLWRNSCTRLYCIENAYYSRPMKRGRRLGQQNSIEKDFGYKSAEDMAEKILNAHEKSVQNNIEREIREANKAADRRLLEVAENGIEIVVTKEKPKLTREEEELAKQPTLKKPIPIDQDMCGKLNIEAEKTLMKQRGLHRKTKKNRRRIADKLCSDECQKTNQSSDECIETRTAACYHKWLGGDLDTIKECCEAVRKDPEHLIFRVRRFCAKRGKATKPSRRKFCKCANSKAEVFQNDIECVDAVLDGCGFRMGRRGVCRKLRGKKTAEEFAKVANKLCKRRRRSWWRFGESESDEFAHEQESDGLENANTKLYLGIGAAALVALSVGLFLKKRNQDGYEAIDQIDEQSQYI